MSNILLNKSYLVYDGHFKNESQPLILANNRSLRYGEGLFETIQMREDVPMLFDLHMERLFRGLALLEIELPKYATPEYLREFMIELRRKNRTGPLTRIRLTILKGEGGVFEDPHPPSHFLIQAWSLARKPEVLNEAGFLIDVYPHARLSTDAFSSLKLNNFLPYAMAASWARKNKLNDALLLNASGRLAESSIANLFAVFGNTILTPSLTEGCIAGVMRSYLLDHQSVFGYRIQEAELPVDTLRQASAVFLSNAGYGIRWIAGFQGVRFERRPVQALHAQLEATLKENYLP